MVSLGHLNNFWYLNAKDTLWIALAAFTVNVYVRIAKVRFALKRAVKKPLNVGGTAETEEAHESVLRTLRGNES